MTTGRNDPCPCGSGRKFKKCCLPNEARTPAVRVLSHADKKRLIKSSAELSVIACAINPDWRESGLARIVVARRQDDGGLVAGVYLVDTLCLGLKSTFCNAGLSSDAFEGDLLRKCYPDTAPVPVGLDLAKEIIFGAIDYAARLGFSPDPDFNLSRHVLGSEGAANRGGVRFGGPDGKPCYVAGPNDDAAAIIRKLTARLGEDGFHFAAPPGARR